MWLKATNTNNMSTEHVHVYNTIIYCMLEVILTSQIPARNTT